MPSTLTPSPSHIFSRNDEHSSRDCLDRKDPTSSKTPRCVLLGPPARQIFSLPLHLFYHFSGLHRLCHHAVSAFFVDHLIVIRAVAPDAERLALGFMTNCRHIFCFRSTAATRHCHRNTLSAFSASQRNRNLAFSKLFKRLQHR